MTTYVETSAAVKLLVVERESSSLERFLSDATDELISTALLTTELRRVGWRQDLDPEDIAAVLDLVTIYEVDPPIFRRAGLIPASNLRTLDALHVAGAIRLGADRLLAYDHRVQEAGAAAGLEILAPDS